MAVSDTMARSLTYLIETSDVKMPGQSTYGYLQEIHNPTKGIGHVSRTVRLTLDFIENLTPFYKSAMAAHKDYAFVVKWEVNGCLEVDFTKVYVREKDVRQANITRNDYASEVELTTDGFELWRTFEKYAGFI